ncbi:MAG: sugar phosphate nucleotidyltransferase [Nocardioidaceae bacterium]
MEAVIIAGGLGTRLRPLTQHEPKHLLPVGGVPFVAHQLAKLGAAGVQHVVLATSFRANRFEAVLGDGSLWGVQLSYLTEAEPLGTAGAIRHVADRLKSEPDDPVMILNGDVLSGHNLGAQLAYHRQVRAAASLHLVEVPDARPYGCVPTDAAGRVSGFVEKSLHPVSRQVNAGCYIFQRGLIDEIPPDRVVSVERQTFPALLAAGLRVFGYRESSYWRDIGTPQALVQGSADVVRGVAPSPAYPYPPRECWVAAQASVAADARLLAGSTVGAEASVGVGAVVEGSIVCPGAVVEAGARVIGSVVGPGASIGEQVVLRDAVVGDRAVVGARCELVGGARVWCDMTIPAGAIRFSSDA